MALGDEHGHLTADGRVTACGLTVTIGTTAQLRRAQRIPNRCPACYLRHDVPAMAPPTAPPKPVAPRAEARIRVQRPPRPRPAPVQAPAEPDGWEQLQDLCRRLDAAANSATRAGAAR